MGWFDSEQTPEKASVTPANAPQRRPAPAPETGSTLGRQVQVDGTIVCGEDLTILGKVEGTIRAKGTLTIAKEAEVRASIDGQRVLVHGRVEGDVHGGERVVLGPTASLIGNIQAPALEITEGAFFKGSVEMRPAGEARGQQKKADAAASQAAGKSAASGGRQAKGEAAAGEGAASGSS